MTNEKKKHSHLKSVSVLVSTAHTDKTNAKFAPNAYQLQVSARMLKSLQFVSKLSGAYGKPCERSHLFVAGLLLLRRPADESGIKY